MPFGKSLVWTEWDGHDWAPAASVTCRPSFHGYGQVRNGSYFLLPTFHLPSPSSHRSLATSYLPLQDGGDGWQTHKEASYHEQQWDEHKHGRRSPVKDHMLAYSDAVSSRQW